MTLLFPEKKNVNTTKSYLHLLFMKSFKPNRYNFFPLRKLHYQLARNHLDFVDPSSQDCSASRKKSPVNYSFTENDD